MPVKRQTRQNRPGRKPHEPSQKDRRIVEAMAACIRQAEIAVVLGIDETTLRKHYRSELDRGLSVANAKVAGNLFKIATGTGREAVTAAIFWLKTRAGWSEYGPPARTSPAPEKMGKKAAAQVEANQPPVDAEWADLVPPKLHS